MKYFLFTPNNNVMASDLVPKSFNILCKTNKREIYSFLFGNQKSFNFNLFT